MYDCMIIVSSSVALANKLIDSSEATLKLASLQQPEHWSKAVDAGVRSWCLPRNPRSE